MAIISSFISLTVKALFLLAIAVTGVICGKKFRDKKDAKKAFESRES